MSKHTDDNSSISPKLASYFHKAFCVYLNKLGLKQTKQRTQILNIVFSLPKHFDAETVAKEIQRLRLSIGLATIYRTLNMMKDAKILTEHHFLNNRACYEFFDEDANHHHLICHTCGEVFEFSDSLLVKRHQEISAKMGFKLRSEKIELWADCVKNNCPKLKKHSHNDCQ